MGRFERPLPVASADVLERPGPLHVWMVVILLCDIIAGADCHHCRRNEYVSVVLEPLKAHAHFHIPATKLIS